MSNKASFIIVPVSNDDLKVNMDRTVFSRDIGYWCTPSGTNGDSVMIGDQIWFVGGKNEQDETENSVMIIGNITNIVDRESQPEIFHAMSSVWNGDWSDRKIVVFRILPVLEKDKLTYDEVCQLFGYKRLKNGSVRVKI